MTKKTQENIPEVVLVFFYQIKLKLANDIEKKTK